VTFASSFTATSLTVNGGGLASATTVYFNSGSTFTITTLSLNGSSGKLITIRSTSPGIYTYLNNTSTNNVSYVDVKDNNASGGQIIMANDGTSVNSGNNLHWMFGPPVTPTVAAVYVITITANWSTAGMTTRDGFVVQASTASDFSGTLFSTSTSNANLTSLTVGTVSPLAANTTYYLRVGAIYSDTTSYANTVPVSTSTLTNLLTGSQFAGVSSFTVTPTGWRSAAVPVPTPRKATGCRPPPPRTSARLRVRLRPPA